MRLQHQTTTNARPHCRQARRSGNKQSDLASTRTDEGSVEEEMAARVLPQKFSSANTILALS
jgi:hypothetical protein